MNELIARVWEYSINNPEGFTLDIKAMKPVREGICVAYLETQDSHDKESLTRVINHALRHEGIIGGWFNEENGRYYFDSVRVFPESQREEAITFAKEQKQIAVFHLSKARQININQ